MVNLVSPMAPGEPNQKRGRGRPPAASKSVGSASAPAPGSVATQEPTVASPSMGSDAAPKKRGRPPKARDAEPEGRNVEELRPRKRLRAGQEEEDANREQEVAESKRSKQRKTADSEQQEETETTRRSRRKNQPPIDNTAEEPERGAQTGKAKGKPGQKPTRRNEEPEQEEDATENTFVRRSRRERRSADDKPWWAATEATPESARGEKERPGLASKQSRLSETSQTSLPDPHSLPPTTHPHLTTLTRHIPRSTITTKWTPLSAGSITAIDTIITDASRPVLHRLRERDARHAQAQTILRTFAARLRSKLARGMPFPPPSVPSTNKPKAGGGRNKGSVAGGGHEAEFDFERTVDAIAGMERTLDPLLHSVALLRREKEREERELKLEYEGLRRLEGVEDEELLAVSQQIGSHMESLKSNLGQIEGVLPAIAKTKAALQGMLCEYLEPEHTADLGAMPMATQSEAPSTEKQPGKRPFKHPHPHQRQTKKKQRRKAKAPQEGSHEEVLLADVKALLASCKLADEVVDEATEPASLPELRTEVELEVLELSSTGDGLAKQKGSDHIYVVPFSIPGDTVKAKVYRHNLDEGWSAADFISVVKPSPLRDDTRVQCPYFAKCSGCQFQMVDYDEQLRIKKNVVVKAYRNFSQLAPELVPGILDTIGSPLQYGYRTKLTPHFDQPKGNPRRGFKKPHSSMPAFGFTPKSTRDVLDIEDCPIATEAVRKGLATERARLAVEYGKYTKGATILLRESTQRFAKASPDATPSLPDNIPASAILQETDTHIDIKTCITDQNATSTEYIDSFVFQNPAGSFFQNNNSILSPFTAYIRSHLLPPNPSPTAKPIRYLIDAYSGSGLFTITQSSLFPGGSIGIDIAEKSILYARTNAGLNNLSKEQCRFIAADAPELFKSVSAYDPDETVVVLDPPRKGCDASFLRQLLEYAPRRVVYVSCNVHTQARDVGVLVTGEVEGLGVEKKEGEEGEEKKKVRYEIESIRGFDFFPQTAHVEGVAVLNRVDA
ncbi:tRNA(m5U54)methyltransferase [Collariella sp. IMI 366227]|nr:tRNA(m5U54)methyltransferase [Collariella sp. IMI 366227]